MKFRFLIISILWAVASYGSQRKYLQVDSVVDCYAFNIDTLSVELAIEARAAFDFGGNSPRRSRACWGIAWNCREDGASFDYVALRLKNTDFGNITDFRAAEIEYGHHRSGADSVIKLVTIEKSHNLRGGDNTIAVEWFDGKMRVFSGEKIPVEAFEVGGDIPSEDSCMVFSTGNLKLRTLVVENKSDMSKYLATGYDTDYLMKRFNNSTDPVEGTWTYLDRVTDDTRARLGGIYTLCVVKDGSRYLILYHSGAKVNSGKWSQMMVKGELIETPFIGHYDLKWYDAMMNLVGNECSASLDSEGILTVSFPIHKSTLRFYKTAMPEPVLMKDVGE